MGLDEHNHRLNLQQSLFSSVLSFAAMLYMVAVAMGFLLIGKLNDNANLHWHASLLIAAFVIPPTVLTVGLMRGIFKDKDGKKDPSEDAGNQSIMDIGKEAVKETVKTVIKAKA